MKVIELKKLLEQIPDEDEISISVDVSTGAHNVDARIFAEIDTVQGNDKINGCFGSGVDATIIAIKI